MARPQKLVQGNLDYENPSAAHMIKACPLLNWRKCGNCRYISLYADNVLPTIRCHQCGSDDTRLMVRESARLHNKNR